MGKFIFFKQLESADCGATCLKMIAQFYNRKIDIRYLRDIAYTNKNGVTLSSLINAADTIGFETLPAQINFDQLCNQVPLPAILHWKNTHYVVAYKSEKKKNKQFIHIADPAYGKLKLQQNEMESLWNVDYEKNGIALLFEPNNNFNPNIDSEVKKIKFSYFLQYLRPVYGKLALIFTLILLIASFNFLYPYINQQLVDRGVKDKSVYFIIYFLSAQFITYTSSMIMEFVQGWMFLTVKIRFGLKIVNDFLIKLMKMPLSFFENKLSSDILLRIVDHEKIENFFSQNTMQFIISVLSFLIFSVVLIQYSNHIFLVFFTGSIISLLWVLWFHKVRKFLNYKKFELESLNRNILYEVVNGISDIKINNFEVKKVKEWRNVQDELVEVNRKNLKLSNIQEFGINYLTQIKNTIILGLAAFMVIEGSITLGTMLAISFIIGQLNAPLEHFVLFIYSLQDAKISLERLIDVYEKKDEEDISDGSDNEIPINGDIVFKNVSFGYQNPNGYKIFENLNLTLKSNCTTAIVGTSGSGKTTLIKLLMKFYEPYSGEILLNGRSIEKFNFNKWREKISVVFQDGYIFSDSVKGNIVMGQNYDENKFNNIISQANLNELIDILPQHAETKIGENGLGLSKGQQQRILIARAMYKNPEILILDEATSALDSVNEKIIHHNLQNFFKGRTVIIIAHRLSTVKNADHILVLKQGTVVEVGNHQQLVDNKKEYYTLVKNQLELGV